MNPDLEALSREIAATSDAWMVPGVQCFDRDMNIGWRRSKFVWVRDAGETMLWYGVDLHVSGSVEMLSSFQSLKRAISNGPNLTDPVTVNSLLGQTGNAWQDVCGGIVWMACVDNAVVVVDADRTTAICRAWIAANREKP